MRERIEDLVERLNEMLGEGLADIGLCYIRDELEEILEDESEAS